MYDSKIVNGVPKNWNNKNKHLWQRRLFANFHFMRNTLSNTYDVRTRTQFQSKLSHVQRLPDFLLLFLLAFHEKQLPSRERFYKFFAQKPQYVFFGAAETKWKAGRNRKKNCEQNEQQRAIKKWKKKEKKSQVLFCVRRTTSCRCDTHESRVLHLPWVCYITFFCSVFRCFLPNTKQRRAKSTRAASVYAMSSLSVYVVSHM